MSCWTDEQWAAFCALWAGGWPGDLTDAERNAGRVLLDGLDPNAAITALNQLVLSGREFYPRPTPSDIAATARQDPGIPTWAEAWKLIERALTAPGYAEARREQIAATGSTFISDDDDRAMLERARQAAVADAHPQVQRFVAVQGWGRLSEAHKGEWTGARLHELRGEWAEQARAVEGREIAALASGSGREGLHQLDPLAAIGVGRRELAP